MLRPVPRSESVSGSYELVQPDLVPGWWKFRRAR